jgi:hypothetical protein
VAVSQGRTTRPVDVRRNGPSSTSSASWRSLGTATIRRLFCVIVARSTGWRIGQGLRRSSGRLWAPPSRPSSVDTTPSSICVRPRRSTATTTRIRCGQSQPAPRPTLTPESCGPGNDIPDGSLSSRPPSSLTRPHGRSTSFAASCPECCQRHVIPSLRDHWAKSVGPDVGQPATD